MSRGRHRATPAAPALSLRLPTSVRLPRPSAAARSLRLPALAVVTLLGAGALGSGPQPAAESTELAPATAENVAERSETAASRSSGRTALESREKVAAPAPATTPAPTPTVVPAPTAEPTEPPAPEPLPAITGQLWTTDAVNVRTGPSADAEQITTAPFATAVAVTGAAQDGWSQVVWDGAVAWVSSRYLTQTQPQPTTARADETSGSAGTSSAACSVNPEIESGLRANATAVYRAVCAAFPGVSAYGGVRPGDSGDHGSGRAVDIMISGDAGWDIARYVQANAAALGVTYVIYQQQIWMAGDPASAWSGMEDRGGATANHFDHVHVSTS